MLNSRVQWRATFSICRPMRIILSSFLPRPPQPRRRHRRCCWLLLLPCCSRAAKKRDFLLFFRRFRPRNGPSASVPERPAASSTWRVVRSPLNDESQVRFHTKTSFPFLCFLCHSRLDDDFELDIGHRRGDGRRARCSRNVGIWRCSLI